MNTQVSPQSNNLRFASIGIVGLLWLILVHEAFYSAAVIWIGNEIFNHCLLVIPASAYLIWEKRKEIHWHKAHISNWAVLFLFGQLLLFLLGVAGDIQLFQHAAVFSMLPTLLWFFLGDKIAWQLKFPLAFIVFAIPVGEQLVPLLQEITADISVYMLQISGIPLFRSGLFIEIPQGKFLVAEACSGISFLIASVVIGNLYAYMNLKTMRRRVFFVLLSVLVPIIANAVRVYGIILVGYWSDMKHAVGADHLIYGWFFFAIVIVMLLAIGEWVRAREKRALAKSANSAGDDDDSGQGGESEASAVHKAQNEQVSAHDNKVDSNAHVTVLSACIGILLLFSNWQAYRMTHLAPAEQAYPPFAIELPVAQAPLGQLKWEPSFNRTTQEYLQAHVLNGQVFDAYYAYFDGSDGELISSLHRLYLQDRWTLKQRERLQIQGKPVIKDVVAASSGSTRHVYYFYLVDGRWLVSQPQAKLQQILQTLQGERSQGAIVAVSVMQNPDRETSSDEVLAFIHDYALRFTSPKQ